uniref:L-type lectin-domain containing receptor kinase 1 n=1 Tax=Pohlia nutans TaxID=140635 RepID=A0A125SL72_9BRYO|nr:L-type lectin-domain containing receptor kinase 1 [Pohlia nutans]
MISQQRHATMAIIWLLMLCCHAFSVNGNFTVSTPLQASDIDCLDPDQCQFFPENQTIAIINISDPSQAVSGVAYYSHPIRMRDPATRTVASFKTSFTFREEPMNYNASATTSEQMSLFKRGDGFTFLFSNSSSWHVEPAGRFGVFTLVPERNSQVVALEFDSWSSNDTDPGLRQEEHVGLDVHSAISNNTCFAYVYSTLGITFWHRDVLYAWIEYDGVTSNLQVRLANSSTYPTIPLINCTYDLYDSVDEKMWMGFSGAHGDAWSIYYIYNWRFTSFGISSEFSSTSTTNVALIAGVAAGGILVAILAVVIVVCVYLRKKRAKKESWDNYAGEMIEMAGMPEFISYKHLSAATKQFSDQSKLGEGGFGSVYRGVLPKTGAAVAVKKVSNDSRQGEKEFLAEVQIISQLRHRNVVELVGFCRDRGKFLLVYELLPKGSLDQALFKPTTPLSWAQRWKIVSGTAAALHYLHEGWRQQVIHRDVKSSNIMLDDEYNPKLGDFGLARLVDHQKNAATTMVAGTYGYIAPEAVGGKFTDKTDVYAFGAVALEIACGRKAYNPNAESYEDLVLVDTVWRRLKDDDLLAVADPLLIGSFDCEQVVVVLKLGLLCSHPDPACRPSMRQVVQVLAGDADVPEVPQSRPDASPYLRNNMMPHISIDDLLSSRSGSQNNKRPVPSSTSSFSRTESSLGNKSALYPR